MQIKLRKGKSNFYLMNTNAVSKTKFNILEEYALVNRIKLIV